jgi:tetratricopeptide (TPR) repeat protein
MIEAAVMMLEYIGEEEKASEKLMELSEVLVGIGKFKEAMEPYKSSLDYGGLSFRVRIRLAVMKKHAAIEGDESILNDVDNIEYYLEKNRYDKALELAEESMKKREGLKELLEAIHTSEGIY